MLADLPEGWHEVPFDQLARFDNGRAFKPEDWGPEGLPIVRIAQITNPNSEMNFFNGPVEERHLLANGDLIFSWSATLAVMKWERGPAVLNQHLFKVTPEDGVDKDWLRFRLEASIPDLSDEAHGTTMKHIRKGTLSSKTTWLPPIKEQRQIAEVLLAGDKVSSADEAVVVAAEKVLQAYLSQAFAQVPGGDHDPPLEDLLERIIDYRGVPPPKSDSGVPLITAKNVRFGFLDPEPREFIAEADYDSWMRRGIPSSGDIMFTTEAPLGLVAEFPAYKAALGQRTLTLVAKPERLHRPYLKWLLLSPPVQDVIQRHGTGSTAKGIKQSTFRKLRFNVPDVEAQREISLVCDAMWRALEGARRARGQFLTTKMTLLSDLVSGRVRVPV